MKNLFQLKWELKVRFWEWVFSWESTQLYVEWINYEIGLTGYGPTRFDKPPTHPKPMLPRWLKRRLDDIQVSEAEIRRQIFEEVLMEQT